MFTFTLNKPKEKCINYPKYLILLKNISTYYFNNDSVFYYLISFIELCTDILNLKYLIVLDLYFDSYDEVVKFNLSKLGTDYIFNEICMHFKDECTGSYPENYVFVKEPDWPSKKYRTDRTPLKGWM